MRRMISREIKFFPAPPASYTAKLYASARRFTAFLPSMVYSLIISATPSSKDTFNFSAAFFTMVSLDENGKPSPVPKLVYDENNAYESKLYKVGEKKHILHNERKS